MASSISSAFSLPSNAIQQNCVRSSTINRIVWEFLFMTSIENLVPNVSGWEVDSEKSVAGSGLRDKHVWQLSTHSVILAPEPGQKKYLLRAWTLCEGEQSLSNARFSLG